MTLESYRNFVAIVESGSILAASNKLLIAQPSLSNQLKNIETYYGAKLLIRNRHRLELTDAGRVFICAPRRSARPKKNFKTRFTIKNRFFRAFKALNPGRKLRLFSAPSV